MNRLRSAKGRVAMVVVGAQVEPHLGLARVASARSECCVLNRAISCLSSGSCNSCRRRTRLVARLGVRERLEAKAEGRRQKAEGQNLVSDSHPHQIDAGYLRFYRGTQTQPLSAVRASWIVSRLKDSPSAF